MQENRPEQTVVYTVDEDTFMRACHALWAYRAMGQRGNLTVAAGLFTLGAFLTYQGIPGVWDVVVLVVAIVIVALDVSRDRLWRSFYRKHPKYPGPITARVADNGVIVDSDEGQNHLPWNAFQSFARTDQALFLIIDQRQFSVIPLEAFDSPQSASAFEDALSRHLRRLPRRFM
ncbi:MAG: YcxB family protein [Pseudomonadota bacterium]